MILGMRLSSEVLYSTLVLTCLLNHAPSYAATTEQQSKPSISVEQDLDDDRNLERSDLEGTTTLTKPPTVPMTDSERASLTRINSRPQLSFGVHGGVIAGQVLDETGYSSTQVGIMLSKEVKWHTRWDLEAELISNRAMGFGIGRTVAIEEWEENSAPYYKLAVHHVFDSADGLSTFGQIKRFHARAIIGWDDLFEERHRYYSEVGVGFGLLGSQIFAVIGARFDMGEDR